MEETYKFERKDWIVLGIFFLIAFSIWTIPSRYSSMPFGEADTAWHYANGDAMASKDHAAGLLDIPYWVKYWYYNYNPVLGPDAIQYPIPTHLNHAIVQIFGQDLFIPFGIYRAIVSMLGIFSVYFLIRKLFGFFPAVISGFCMIFSYREFITYLFGQYPSLLSFVYIPLVLYCAYQFLESIEEKPKYEYVYFCALLVACQYLFHLQGVFLSAIIVAVVLIMSLIKTRKIPNIGKEGLIHIGAAFAILIIISSPFIMMYYGSFVSENTEKNMPNIMSRLFSWYIKYSENPSPWGNNDFSKQYSWFVLPFMIIGIIAIGIRRKNKDLIMLSWIIGLYIAFHADFIFGTEFYGRIARMYISEPMLFFSLFGIGINTAISFVKIKNSKWFFTAAALIIIYMSIGANIVAMAESSYTGLSRISENQFSAAQWIKKNTLPESKFFITGTVTYPKQRFMLALSQRVMQPGANITEAFAGINQQLIKNNEKEIKADYAIFDYSDLSRIQGTEAQIQSLQKLEKNYTKKVYDFGNIRIYKVNQD